MYHIIARGNDRQVLFRVGADYREYLSRLGAGLRRCEIRCHAYCLMPNHVHLLLEPAAVPVSRLLQGVQGAFAQYLNRRYRRAGHRFLGRFRAILCEKESYSLELIRYLHLNPVRAGLTRSPEAWPWSSHRAYLGNPAEEVPIDSRDILEQFHRDPLKARKAYARFVQEGLGMGHREEFYELWEQRVLGNQAFAEKALTPRRKAPGLPIRVPVLHIVRAVAQELGIPAERIATASRARGPARARAFVAYLARELAKFPLTLVAREIRRDPATLSHAVRRLEGALTHTPDLRDRVDRIARRLRRSVKGQKVKKTA
jgi:REP element-mobilizing transposase RayT